MLKHTSSSSSYDSDRRPDEEGRGVRGRGVGREERAHVRSWGKEEEERESSLVAVAFSTTYARTNARSCIAYSILPLYPARHLSCNTFWRR